MTTAKSSTKQTPPAAPALAASRQKKTVTKPRNAFYAQSGGVTAVFNVSAAAVIETCRKHKDKIGKLYAGRNGIAGALSEELIDTSKESTAAIARLKHTPGACFGSARVKLPDPKVSLDDYRRIIEVFAAHNIGICFLNGGNDSMDTAEKLARAAKLLGYDLQCIGIPKTVDNDLAETDCSPGFGSAAKYLATSMREASFDVAAMAATSTQVFIMEVMGRHAGWLTAATGMAREPGKEGFGGPQILLLPEVAFNPTTFLARVQATVKAEGFCAIAASEGVKDAAGQFLGDQGYTDAFGHTQLGGAGQAIAQLVKSELKLKYHLAVPDYLQRSARHLASQTDVEHAYAVGRAAVELALAGANAVMPAIRRRAQAPYRWVIEAVPLAKVANHEKMLPKSFITRDGFHITAKAREYFEPLLMGKDIPPFRGGLPYYVRLKNLPVKKLLASTKVETKL